MKSSKETHTSEMLFTISMAQSIKILSNTPSEGKIDDLSLGGSRGLHVKEVRQAQKDS